MAETQPLMESKPLYVEYSKFSGSTVEFDERGAKTSLNTLTAAVMVAGTLAGSGTLALPGAVINTGENALAQGVGALQADPVMTIADFHPKY